MAFFKNENMDNRTVAKRVFELEASAIRRLADFLTEDFNQVINKILKTSGRVIVCGMGKSGIIGKKIAATLASTGTPSFFMHPGEAFHGDLGMITPEDVFLAISNSGETDEVLKLLPFLRDNQNILISITGVADSTLARASHHVIHTGNPIEACPLKLAPTTSTTATLVLGDALAVALMEQRGFKPENFARFHPGGSLGRRMLHQVCDEMVTYNLPLASPATNAPELVHIISRGCQGIAIVVDDEDVKGIVTDGDLRRNIEKYKHSFFDLTAQDMMTSGPLTVSPNTLVFDAYELMEKENVNKLLVVDSKKLVGILRK